MTAKVAAAMVTHGRGPGAPSPRCPGHNARTALLAECFVNICSAVVLVLLEIVDCDNGANRPLLMHVTWPQYEFSAFKTSPNSGLIATAKWNLHFPSVLEESAGSDHLLLPRHMTAKSGSCHGDPW